MIETPSEHTRFQQYLHDLEQVPDHDELDLVDTVLRDPDQAMAVSAVLQHIDHRARGLDADRYAAWAAKATAVVEGHDLLERRIRDWILLKSLDTGQAINATDLADATDWLQRTLAETTTSSATLTLLAEMGRTRRIRDTARTRAHRPSA